MTTNKLLTQAVLECEGHQNMVLPFASENSCNSLINKTRKTALKQDKKKEKRELRKIRVK